MKRLAFLPLLAVLAIGCAPASVSGTASTTTAPEAVTEAASSGAEDQSAADLTLVTMKVPGMT